MNAVLKTSALYPRLCDCRHQPRRLGATKKSHCRNRNAGFDGHSWKNLLPTPTPQGRAHYRFAAHDDSNRRADPNPGSPGCHRALGFVQYLLNPRSRCRRNCCRGTPVFAVKGETLDDYWEYTHRIFEWPNDANGEVYSNMILDDGGDATLLLHLGVRAEKDISVLDITRVQKKKSACSTRSKSVV